MLVSKKAKRQMLFESRKGITLGRKRKKRPNNYKENNAA